LVASISAEPKLRNIMKKLLCTIVACFGSLSAAQANVVYQWQNVTDMPGPEYKMSIRIEFTDEAVAKGTYEYAWDSYRLDDWQGFVSLYAYMPYVHGLDVWSSSSSPSMGFTPRHGDGIFVASFTFGPDSILSGTLYANNTDADIKMSGSDGLFGVTRYASDRVLANWNPYEGSAFSTGKFMRVSEPSGELPGGTVPEPGSIALIGLGMLGLGVRAKLRANP
jgi:hypothetical protein